MKKNSRTQALLQKRRSAARRNQALLWGGAAVLGAVAVLVGRSLGPASEVPTGAANPAVTPSVPPPATSDAPVDSGALGSSPMAQDPTAPSEPTASPPVPDPIRDSPTTSDDEMEPTKPLAGETASTAKGATPEAIDDPTWDRIAKDAAQVRHRLTADSDLNQIAGIEGKANSQVRSLARGFAQLQLAQGRPARSGSPEQAKPSERQQMRRLLAESIELTGTLERLPELYDLADQLQRLQARGHLIIHLMTLEDLLVPEAIKGLWGTRIASVKGVIDALGQKPNTEAETQAWANASRLLDASKGLVDTLRSGLR